MTGSVHSRVLSLVLACTLAATAPVLAQQVRVQNDATVKVANGGTLDLLGARMDFGDAGATARLRETSGGRVTGGRLEATRALNAPSQADPAGLGAVISASENLGDVTVVRGHTAQTGGGNTSIQRYYSLSATGTNSGLSATLTHAYHDAELNGLTESNLELFKSTDGGSTWTEKGVDGRDAQANTVTLSGIASFSRWTLGSTASPLPVELASFEGRAVEQGGAAARLRWTTAAETDNAGFRVQHRTDEETAWQRLGFVESHAPGGSSTEAQTYRFTAEDLGVGTHQFRLQQVDLDGTTQLHDPVTVTLRMEKPVRLRAPAPNPVRQQAALSFAVREHSETHITLYNALGQQVRTVYQGTPSAEEARTARLDASSLASGVYFLRLRTAGHTKTRRLTVVR